MFALFEDDFISFMWPQASLPSAAQPAVMDIRRLLALSSDKVERGDACLRCFHILNFS